MGDPYFNQKYRLLSFRDALFRVNHQSWWKEELPSKAEYQEARVNLEQHGWKVDYILMHCAPASVQEEIASRLYEPDALTDFFEEVRGKCQFKNWFFGHYYSNMVIAKRFVFLYEEMIELQ